MPQIIDDTPGILAGLQSASNSLKTTAALDMAKRDQASQLETEQVRRDALRQSMEGAARKQQQEDAAAAAASLYAGIRARDYASQVEEQNPEMARAVTEEMAQMRPILSRMDPQTARYTLQDLEGRWQDRMQQESGRQFANRIQALPDESLSMGGAPEAAQALKQGWMEVAKQDPAKAQALFQRHMEGVQDFRRTQAQSARAIASAATDLGLDPQALLQGGVVDPVQLRSTGLSEAAVDQVAGLAADLQAGIITPYQFSREAKAIQRRAEDRREEWERNEARYWEGRTEALAKARMAGAAPEDVKAIEDLYDAMYRGMHGGQAPGMLAPAAAVDPGAGGQGTERPQFVLTEGMDDAQRSAIIDELAALKVAGKPASAAAALLRQRGLPAGLSAQEQLALQQRVSELTQEAAAKAPKGRKKPLRGALGLLRDSLSEPDPNDLMSHSERVEF